MALQHLRSSTANKRPLPAGMSDGQLAINTNLASPGLFFKDSNGDLVKVGPVHVGATAPNVSPAAGGQTGNTKGEQWLDTSGTNPVLKIWDGSAWQSEAGEFVNVSGDTMTGALTMANQQAVRFSETTANGSNYIALQANAALASNKTITLPDTTGTVVTTGDTGTVTSTMIANDTILNADVNASAAIAGTKVSPDFGSQTVATSGIFSSAAGTAAAPSIAFTGDLNTGIYSPGADQLAVSTGGTGRLFVDSSGRLLVGTSSAQGYSLVQVQGNAGAAAGHGQLRLARGQAAGDFGANEDIGIVEFTNNAGGEYARITCLSDATGATGDYPGRLVFSTTADGASSPTERMRISNNGAISMGGGNINALQVLTLATGQPATGSGALTFAVGNNLTNGRYIRFQAAGGSEIGSITQASASSVAYNTSSDYRLKENIVPLTGAIDRLNDLQVHRFNFIADPECTVDGFIAHEAQAVVPECATGEKDAVDEQGNPIYQGIDQSKLVPLLTAALQEAVAKIETLEAKVAALEAQ